MDLHSTLKSRVAGSDLPLAAVSVTATARPDTPLLLMLHWHGFEPNSGLDLHTLHVPARPRPATALQIDEGWRTAEPIEAGILDAAWRMGAWALERSEQRGCETVGAAPHEAVECRQAFGDYGFCPLPAPALDDLAPDRNALLALGARIGFIRWLFRPLQYGITPPPADDATVDSAGTREPPCPLSPRPLQRPWRRARTVYRFGRGRHLWTPGAPS